MNTTLHSEDCLCDDCFGWTGQPLPELAHVNEDTTERHMYYQGWDAEQLARHCVQLEVQQRRPANWGTPNKHYAFSKCGKYVWERKPIGCWYSIARLDEQGCWVAPKPDDPLEEIIEVS